MRSIALLFPLVLLACTDGQGPSEPPAGLCTAINGSQAPSRCAVVAGTVRNSEGHPLAGATVRLFRDSGDVFLEGPARTDAQGHFRMEADLQDGADPGTLASIPAHLRARVESGVDAVEVSVPITAVFALEGSRPPVGTAQIVIEDPAVWPSAPSGRIVFVRHSQLAAEVYLINADGTALAPLHPTTSLDLSPVWTPDGGAVLFSQFGKLSLIDPNGGNLRPFGSDLVGYKLRWAPDGRHLAFLGDYTDASGGLHLAAWITQPDGSGPQRLPTQDDQLCLRECSRIVAFEWYPDSDRLAYYVSTPGTAGDLRAGSFTTRLSDSTIEAIGGPVPVWADDGSRAARIRGNDLIEIVDPNGVQLALFSLGDQVAWSPDGEWLTYVTHESDPDRFELWVADRSGLHRRRIALDATEPDWQP